MRDAGASRTMFPPGRFPRSETYDLTLRAGGEPRALEFDGAAAEGGWNALGEFDLPAGDVRLDVSDRVIGAARWSPTRSGGSPSRDPDDGSVRDRESICR